MKTTSKSLAALLLVGISFGILKLDAQTRSYIEFIQPAPLWAEIIQGVRIKKTADNQKYWLLGHGSTGTVSTGTYYTTMVARVDPTIPFLIPHADYTINLNPAPAGSSAAVDFVVENDFITTTGTVKRDFLIPPSQEVHTSLFPIQANLMPGGFNRRYNFANFPQYGKAIVHKTDAGNGGPAYILASDANNGTVVTSVSVATMLPNWQIFIPSPLRGTPSTSTSTYVNDMIQDANGDYYIVGYMLHNTTKLGVVIKVNQNGTYTLRKTYPNPAGGDLEFSSIAMAPGTPNQRYIISGTDGATGQRKGIFVAAFDINGTPYWSFTYRVANGNTDAIASRHTITEDNDPNGSLNYNIVIAGTLQHDGAPQYTTGTLLRHLYNVPDYAQPLYCGGVIMWKEYGYFDINRWLQMNIRFGDVTQRVRDTPPLGGEVAVVGYTVGWQRPNGNYQDYMLWMDTGNDMLSEGSGCYTNDVYYECNTLTLEPEQPLVNSLSNINYTTMLSMNRILREPVYYCSDLFYYGYKANTEEEQVPTIHSTESLQVSPIPNEGGISSVDLSLVASDNLHIALYDAAGAKVMDIASEYFKAGKHTISFDCSKLTSGLYALRVQGITLNKSLMLPVVR